MKITVRICLDEILVRLQWSSSLFSFFSLFSLALENRYVKMSNETEKKTLKSLDIQLDVMIHDKINASMKFFCARIAIAEWHVLRRQNVTLNKLDMIHQRFL